MNRKLYIAACILCLISCSKTDVVLTGYGYLTAAVTRDNSTIDVTTKADDNTDSEITLNWMCTMELNWFRQLMTTRL